jgi:hypothetical protein
MAPKLLMTIMIGSMLIAACTKGSRSSDDDPEIERTTLPPAETPPAVPRETPGETPDDEVAADPVPDAERQTHVTLQMLYIAGDTPTNRVIMHARRQPGQLSWSQTEVARSHQDLQASGRASLVVDAEGRPSVSYLRHVRTTLLRPATQAVVWRGTTDPTIVTSTDNSQSLTMSLYDRFLPTIIASPQTGTSELRLYELADGATPSVRSMIVIDTDVTAPLTDAISVAVGDTLHALYLNSGRLHHRSRRGAEWTARRTLDVPGCNDLRTLTSAHAGDSIALLYTCSHRLADGSEECLIGVSGLAAEGTLTHAKLGIVNHAGDCAPFSADRPAIAADGQKRLHVAYRRRAPDDLWSMTYVHGTLAAGFSAPVALGAPSARTGFAHIAALAQGDALVAWFDGEALRLASELDGDTPSIEHLTLNDEREPMQLLAGFVATEAP